MNKNRRQERRERLDREKWDTNDQGDDAHWEIESNLEPGMLRFLAHVIEDGLQAGLRTQEDFIRHFPPVEIMQGLADRPDLRANILVPTTGMRPKIAAKKTAESAGQDLQIALDEGETDAEVIVSLFHPDDRVRYLDKTRLWNYIIEPKFWTRTKGSGEGFEQAKSHVTFILDRAIEDHIVTFRDVVDGIGVGTMVQHLPVDQLQTVIERALSNGRSNRAFTEQDMLNVVPLKALVDHIPLSMFWDRVVCPKVAEQNALMTGARTHTAPTGTNGADTDRTDLDMSDRPGISYGTPDSRDAHAETY